MTDSSGVAASVSAPPGAVAVSEVLEALSDLPALLRASVFVGASGAVLGTVGADSRPPAPLLAWARHARDRSPQRGRELEDVFVTAAHAHHLLRELPSSSTRILWVHVEVDGRRGNLALVRRRLSEATQGPVTFRPSDAPAPARTPAAAPPAPPAEATPAEATPPGGTPRIPAPRRVPLMGRPPIAFVEPSTVPPPPPPGGADASAEPSTSNLASLPTRLPGEHRPSAPAPRVAGRTVSWSTDAGTLQRVLVGLRRLA